jgi:hypothetical protein
VAESAKEEDSLANRSEEDQGLITAMCTKYYVRYEFLNKNIKIT